MIAQAKAASESLRVDSSRQNETRDFSLPVVLLESLWLGGSQGWRCDQRYLYS